MSNQAPAIPLTVVAATSNANITKFLGFSIYEDAAATAQWTFRHGSATGTILASVKLAASESATVMFPFPIATPEGVWVVEVSGSITGTVYAAGPAIT